jgi:hypothetical protein
MNVHLIRSEEYSEDQFKELVDFLQSFDGPVQFIGAGPSAVFEKGSLVLKPVEKDGFFKQEEPNLLYRLDLAQIPDERVYVCWKDLFSVCREYRKTHDLPGNDLVILLTEIANEYNWFSALDPSNCCNGFVHTDEWEHYVKCSGVFPVAYLIASLVMQKHLFKDMKALKKAMHTFPLGCINDFCEHKREIMLKLRTADVCHDCMTRIKDKLEPLQIQQLLNIFEGVRLRILFTQNFRQNLKPSTLRVTERGKIFLPNYGNVEIRLTPLEKTLYLFFLNHPEGIMLHDLVDHKEELRGIYARFSTSGLLAEIHRRVDSLVDVTSNSASEKISKIKAAFVKAIGKELAKHYYIQGEHSSPKFIPLNADRK